MHRGWRHLARPAGSLRPEPRNRTADPLGPPAPAGGIESLCIELGAISSGASRDILLTFHLHESAGDEYQGDTITFDIEFTLHQDNDDVLTGASQPHSDTPGTQCGDNAALPVTPLGGGPPPGPTTWYQDLDFDNFGNPSVTLVSVTQPPGYVADNTDCDDGQNTINPGATEIVGDGIDQNCDGFDVVSSVNAGDIIVSEIMMNPSAVSAAAGEWFEVYNTRFDVIVDLAGWTVRDLGVDAFIVATSVLVPPGEYRVFAINGNPLLNGGVTADYVYGGMVFSNVADEVELVDPSVTIVDTVAYDSGLAWPVASGAATSLNPTLLNSVANDAAASWCLASTPLSGGDLGTPRVTNDPCP